MIEISKRDIDAIFESMGTCDGVVSFIEDFHFDAYAAPAILLSLNLVPLFWISVATWYCEQEHASFVDRDVVPDWTPLDLTHLISSATSAYNSNVLALTGFKVSE